MASAYSAQLTTREHQLAEQMLGSIDELNHVACSLGGFEMRHLRSRPNTWSINNATSGWLLSQEKIVYKQSSANVEYLSERLSELIKGLMQDVVALTDAGDIAGAAAAMIEQVDRFADDTVDRFTEIMACIRDHGKALFDWIDNARVLHTWIENVRDTGEQVLTELESA